MFWGTKSGSYILASPLFSPDAGIHTHFRVYSPVFELYIMFFSSIYFNSE